MKIPIIIAAFLLISCEQSTVKDKKEYLELSIIGINFDYHFMSIKEHDEMVYPEHFALTLLVQNHFQEKKSINVYGRRDTIFSANTDVAFTLKYEEEEFFLKFINGAQIDIEPNEIKSFALRIPFDEYPKMKSLFAGSKLNESLFLVNSV